MIPEYEPGSVDEFRANMNAKMQDAIDAVFYAHPDMGFSDPSVSPGARDE